MNNEQSEQQITESTNTVKSNVDKNLSCVGLYATNWKLPYLLGDRDAVSQLYEKCSLPERSNHEVNYDVARKEYLKMQKCLLQNGYKFSHGSNKHVNLENWTKEI